MAFYPVEIETKILHVADKAFNHLPPAFFYFSPYLCPLFLSLSLLTHALLAWTHFLELSPLNILGMALMPWGLWLFSLPECSSPTYPCGSLLFSSNVSQISLSHWDLPYYLQIHNPSFFASHLWSLSFLFVLFVIAFVTISHTVYFPHLLYFLFVYPLEWKPIKARSVFFKFIVLLA